MKKFPVEKIQDKLNAVLEDINEFINDARASYDDKSERWQESDKGQAVDTWIGELEQARDDLENAIAEFDGKEEAVV